MKDIEFIPLKFDENLKEILAQHRLILEMDAKIIKIMCMPPLMLSPQAEKRVAKAGLDDEA